MFRLSDAPSADIPCGARSVGHHTVPAGWVDSVFTVQHVAIYWGISGKGEMETGNKVLQIEPNQIGIYLPGQDQIIRSAITEDWEYCWWTMDGPLAEQIIRGYGFEAGVHQAGPAPINLIHALQSVIQGVGKRNEINSATLAYQILSVAAQGHGTPEDSLHHEKLAEDATNLILASWQDPDFCVDALASKLNIHRSTLSRRFHAATGSTLMEYITSIRIQNAIAMLRETSLSVAEIARQCGYTDPNYFSKVIKTLTGMAPSDYRKRAT